MTTSPDPVRDLRAVLESHGQGHLLRFTDELSPGERAALLEQIAAIDFAALDGLIEDFVRNEPTFEPPGDLEPAPFVPHDGDHAAYHAAGEELIAAGRVAAFTVAGGQGTRLGWNGPKGTYPATPVTGKPLFRIFAEQIAAAQRRYGVTIPWLIMTSPENDAETRSFFHDNNNFGLNRPDISMFTQGSMPSIELETGRLLLAERGRLAVNPDGHGGSLRALRNSGAIDHLAARGVELISYVQVDNPLARIIDPVFIGIHATDPDSSGEMSSKMVPKAGADEKVGVFCRAGGRTVVVEYSDLPEALARDRDDAGNLRYCAGSIALHMIGVDFVRRLTEDPHAFGLPFHRAVKKVPYVDPETGQRVEPDAPNAVKLETFVFDALPLASSSLVYETSRVEEFAPIKNASGADSTETSHALQIERAARWLEARGISVPRDADGTVRAAIEISPLTACEPAELDLSEIPASIEPGAEIVI